MKIVDCFTFYNELDMLYYRLSVLEPYVDYFVLVEATLTFRGCTKPMFYNENKERYGRFAHKIIHVIDDGLNPSPIVNPALRFKDGVWQNEIHQRNRIDIGIRQLDLGSEDILIVGDIDEIPNPQVLQNIRENPTLNIHYMALSQDMYYYNLNTLNLQKWFHAKVVSYHFYNSELNREPQKCREIVAAKCIEHGGWHLSYFGDASFIQNKIKQFAHQEWNDEKYTNVSEIEKKIQNNEDLFGRNNEKWIKIPVEKNQFLPPLMDLIPK